MNIKDLPKDVAVSRDELKAVRGGSRTGTFATEIVSMSLSGAPGKPGPLGANCGRVPPQELVSLHLE